MESDNLTQADAERENAVRIGWWWLAFAGIAILLLLAVALAVPVLTLETQMDALTGTRREAGLHSRGPYQFSALDERMTADGAGVLPEWVMLTRRRHNVFGRLLSSDKGDRPAIYPLVTAPEGFVTPLDTFIARASAVQIAEFAATMRDGDEKQRAGAVRGVIAGLGVEDR